MVQYRNDMYDRDKKNQKRSFRNFSLFIDDEAETSINFFYAGQLCKYDLSGAKPKLKLFDVAFDGPQKPGINDKMKKPNLFSNWFFNGVEKMVRKKFPGWACEARVADSPYGLDPLTTKGTCTDYYDDANAKPQESRKDFCQLPNIACLGTASGCGACGVPPGVFATNMCAGLSKPKCKDKGCEWEKSNCILKCNTLKKDTSCMQAGCAWKTSSENCKFDNGACSSNANTRCNAMVTDAPGESFVRHTGLQRYPRTLNYADTKNQKAGFAPLDEIDTQYVCGKSKGEGNFKFCEAVTDEKFEDAYVSSDDTYRDCFDDENYKSLFESEFFGMQTNPDSPRDSSATGAFYLNGYIFAFNSIGDIFRLKKVTKDGKETYVMNPCSGVPVYGKPLKCSAH